MARFFNHCCLIAVALFLISACSQKDKFELSFEEKIDSLFLEWDKPYSPGAAVAVLKDGEVIFKKGYGRANLEHDIPITPATIFHIASESKQFATFCIALLAQQGKLSLDDDIRKHLAYVRDFGKTITIRHLIHHTSGLRDQWQLLAISGTRLDDVITQDHVIKLVQNQKELNFEPGSRYLYCNTGYTLLAEIVKSVSGKSLREFAYENIFQPLGMHNTHFHDDYREVVKGRANSYAAVDSVTFRNSILSYSTIGATSLFTTVEDEAKWLNNYFTAHIGAKEIVEQMHERGVLNSGDTLDYAFAIGWGEHKGWKTFGHGGSDAGFRTYAVRIPEARLGIIVFSNLNTFNTRAIAMQVADLILEDRSKAKTENNADYDKNDYTYAAGKYFNDEGNQIEIIDSTNVYIKVGNYISKLIPLSKDIFESVDERFHISFADKQLFLKQQGRNVVFRKQEEFTLHPSRFNEFTGMYYNDETDARYSIAIENNELVLKHLKFEHAKMNQVIPDQFSTSYWWMSNLNFFRDKQGKVTGFEVNNGRVLHLKFKKL